MSTLQNAAEWSKPPWEITGEKLTPWRRLVWRCRYELYADQLSEQNRRLRQDLELQRMRNGR